MKTKIKNFIMRTWELPQNVLGFIIMKIINAKHYCAYEDVNVYSWNNGGGMSLGKYIFIPYKTDTPMNSYIEKFIKHEYGHSIQSKYLGWFYLLIIGLPSLIWAGCFDGYRKKHNVSYYDFYTEKSADKLGGVNRGE